MAAYQKFEPFVSDLCHGLHNLSTSGNTLKIMLTNSAPSTTWDTSTQVTQISTGNGYASGGSTCQITSSTQTGGLFKLIGANVVFTAAGGTIGPFRYPVLYNSSTATVTGPMISWYDYGSSITLNDTETFTVSFDQSSGIFQLS